MSIIYEGKMVSAEQLTVAAHGEVATDIHDGFRNDTAAGGSVKIRFKSGIDHTFPNVPSGFIQPCDIDRVYETGTTLATVEVYRTK